MCTFASPSETEVKHKIKFIDNGACGDIEKKLSVLSCSALEERTEFIDNTERDNEVKRDYSLYNSSFFELKGTTISRQTSKTRDVKEIKSSSDSQEEKEKKSERRMPWLPKAKKDVVSCEKLRGSANRN